MTVRNTVFIKGSVSDFDRRVFYHCANCCASLLSCVLGIRAALNNELIGCVQPYCTANAVSIAVSTCLVLNEVTVKYGITGGNIQSSTGIVPV